MDIKRVWKIFKSCNYDVSTFFNNHVIPHIARKRYILLPKAYGKYSVYIDNIFYSLNSFSEYIFWQVECEYNYKDIQPNDIVLDVGANVGYFSLHVSNACDKIFSVEPLFINELEENIKLNKLQNKITILPYALSLSDIDIQFENKKGRATGRTLTELISMCGGHVDFLKCDCEGGEWIIEPHQLAGIRRIEMEVHRFNKENVHELIDKLFVNYNVTIDNEGVDAVLVHAFLKAE